MDRLSYQRVLGVSRGVLGRLEKSLVYGRAVVCRHTRFLISCLEAGDEQLVVRWIGRMNMA